MVTIILDIDGVLSPDPSGPDLLPAGFSRKETAQSAANLSPDMQTPWLQELIDRYNVVWGSIREDRSNDILKMLNIDAQLPYIPIDTSDVGLGTWKLKSIKKWVSENLPADEVVIWVEDEIEKDAYLWGEDRGNTFIYSPKLEEGLTKEDLNTIYEKAASSK